MDGPCGGKWTIARCRLEDVAFSNFDYARFAVDITFQERNRPSRNLAEGIRYCSGKQSMYGYKVEVSALHNVLAIQAPYRTLRYLA